MWQLSPVLSVQNKHGILIQGAPSCRQAANTVMPKRWLIDYRLWGRLGTIAGSHLLYIRSDLASR